MAVALAAQISFLSVSPGEGAVKALGPGQVHFLKGSTSCWFRVGGGGWGQGVDR